MNEKKTSRSARNALRAESPDTRLSLSPRFLALLTEGRQTSHPDTAWDWQIYLYSPLFNHPNVCHVNMPVQNRSCLASCLPSRRAYHVTDVTSAPLRRRFSGGCAGETGEGLLQRAFKEAQRRAYKSWEAKPWTPLSYQRSRSKSPTCWSFLTSKAPNSRGYSSCTLCVCFWRIRMTIYRSS